MNKDEIRQVAIDLMTAMPKGDIERADELLAADLKWSVLGSPGLSRAELLDAARFMSSAKRSDFHIVATTVEGERVAMEAEGDFLFEDGKEYRNSYHFLFIVRDGKVVEGKEYLDTALVKQVFG